MEIIGRVVRKLCRLLNTDPSLPAFDFVFLSAEQKPTVVAVAAAGRECLCWAVLLDGAGIRNSPAAAAAAAAGLWGAAELRSDRLPDGLLSIFSSSSSSFFVYIYFPLLIESEVAMKGSGGGGGVKSPNKYL